MSRRIAVLRSGFSGAFVLAALLSVTSGAFAQDKSTAKLAGKPAVAQNGESWPSRLVGRIRDATKTNPTNETGITKVRFTLDRGGQVVQSSVAESSGSTALDLEAIAIVTRAAPFPPPSGADASGNDLTFVVPIRFAARPPAEEQSQASLARPDWTPAPSDAPLSWPGDAPALWPPDAPVQPFLSQR